MPGVYWYNDTHPVNKGPFSMKKLLKKKKIIHYNLLIFFNNKFYL